MNTSRRWIRAVAFASALVSPASVIAAGPQPDFLLEDVNPNSPRYQRLVSPRDYRQQVTAYYFGHET